MKKIFKRKLGYKDNYNDRKNFSQDHFLKDFEISKSFSRNRIVYFCLYYHTLYYQSREIQ